MAGILERVPSLAFSTAVHAALAGVVAQPAIVYSDKDQTFLNVIKRDYVTKSGRQRRIIATIPLPDMLSRLLKPATGRQVRRTTNYGFTFLPSYLPASISSFAESRR